MSDSKLTLDQFWAERRKLGPLPPWWRWWARRRWWAAEFDLYRRYEGWLDMLRKLLNDINRGPSDDH